MQRVVVVGAGVIGLSTALHLLERFPGALDLTVVSDKFSPDVTSDRASALIYPSDFRTEEEKSRSPHNQDEDVQRWTRGTFEKFHAIYSSKENAEVKICLEQGYVLLDFSRPDPWFKDLLFGFRHVALDSVEAKLLHIPPSCVDVWAFGTYVVDVTVYLHWLTDKIKKEGGKFERRKISSFNELSSYDIIINCTGLASISLLDDKLMRPVRGQAVAVKAPWLKQWLVALGPDKLDYVFPREGEVLLGGTKEDGVWNTTPDPKTTESILQNCQKYFPSLCKAEVVESTVGLRPLRNPMRLESCAGPADSLLVHCYGHGAQGIVMSWGSAMDIGDIVQQKLQPK